MNGNNDNTKRNIAPPPVPDDDIKPEDFFYEGRETISQYYEKRDYEGLRKEIESVIVSYYEIFNNFTNGDVFHDRDAFRENAINNGIYIEKQIKEIFALYNEISEKEEFQEVNEKIEDFLKDVNVTVNFADVLIKTSVGGNSNLTKVLIPLTTQRNLEKIFAIKNNRIESIEKLDKALNLFELKNFVNSEEYKFLDELRTRLKENKIKIKKIKKVNDIIKFIRETKKVPKNLNLENLEKYRILSAHLNFKKQISKIFHNCDEYVLDNICLDVTEKVIRGEKIDFNSLNTLLVKEQIPNVSYDKLKSNKEKINDSISDLKDACYLQKIKHKKENSWKYKFKLLVLSASLITLGTVVHVNNLPSKAPDLIENKTEVTRRMYEDKKDAIQKMENDVLNSISNRKITIRKGSNKLGRYKNEKIQRVKNKGREWNEKRKKIIEILKN